MRRNRASGARVGEPGPHKDLGKEGGEAQGYEKGVDGHGVYCAASVPGRRVEFPLPSAKLIPALHMYPISCGFGSR